LPPIVNVLLFNDWIEPLPLKDRPVAVPLDGLAEIDAVGVPLPLLTKANLAEEVEIPPKSKSSEVAVGSTLPKFLWK